MTSTSAPMPLAKLLYRRHDDAMVRMRCWRGRGSPTSRADSVWGLPESASPPESEPKERFIVHARLCVETASPLQGYINMSALVDDIPIQYNRTTPVFMFAYVLLLGFAVKTVMLCPGIFSPYKRQREGAGRRDIPAIVNSCCFHVWHSRVFVWYDLGSLTSGA